MKDEITREERVDNLKGMGCSRKRVEDARFTQGKGNYVDDIKLQGCCSAILPGRLMATSASSRSMGERQASPGTPELRPGWLRR